MVKKSELRDQVARRDGLRFLTSSRAFASMADAAANGAGTEFALGPHIVVWFFMMAQSAELALKAYLRCRGVPLEKLRREFGHDLRRLFMAARRRRFAAPALPNVFFEKLARNYLEAKRLQYPNVDGFSLPPMLATREMVDGFIQVATPLVYGDAQPDALGMGVRFGAVYQSASLATAIAQVGRNKRRT